MKKGILEDLYNALSTYQDFPNDGVVFKDILPIFMDPELTTRLVCLLIDTIPDEVECIVAPESRGFMLGVLVAFSLGIEFVPIRKKGKLPGDTLSYNYATEYSEDSLEIQLGTTKNKECWFIDDVYATGGTYLATKYLVDKDQGNLLGGTVLLDVINKKPEEITELLEEVK